MIPNHYQLLAQAQVPDPPGTLEFLGGAYKVYFTQFLAGKTTDPVTGRPYFESGSYKITNVNDPLVKAVVANYKVYSKVLWDRLVSGRVGAIPLIPVPKGTGITRVADRTQAGIDVNQSVDVFILKNPDWTTKYGIIEGPKPREIRAGMSPSTGESIKSFTARGGYLIYKGRLWIDRATPTWVPRNDPDWEAFWLGVEYRPAPWYDIAKNNYGTFRFFVYGVKPNWFHKVGDWARSAINFFCRQTSSAEINMALQMASTNPKGAAVAAAWQAIATLCGRPASEPLPDLTPLPPPTTETPWWQRKETLYVVGGLAAIIAAAAVVKAARS